MLEILMCSHTDGMEKNSDPFTVLVIIALCLCLVGFKQWDNYRKAENVNKS